MLYGIGIDMVDVARFRAAMDRRGERFLRRLFTERELGYCMKKRRPEVHLAARFAAKVSFCKAMGKGFGFRDIEVLNARDGAPVLKVSKRIAPGGLRLSVTLSHTDELSVAGTVVEKAD